MRKPVYDVGINDAPYMINHYQNGRRYKCPFYSVWLSMLERCYSYKYQETHPTYEGCSVVKEWHSFMAFKAWMLTQDWEGKQLDKDIINIWNKVYSPENCLFVSHAINSLLTDCAANRGDLPQGVDFSKGKYRARCNVNGKRRHLGFFDTVRAAHRVYVMFKSNHIFHIANQQEDHRVKDGLIRHAYALIANLTDNSYWGIT